MNLVLKSALVGGAAGYSSAALLKMKPRNALLVGLGTAALWYLFDKGVSAAAAAQTASVPTGGSASQVLIPGTGVSVAQAQGLVADIQRVLA